MATNNKTLLEFRNNLLTEDKSYLGRRIGDVLNGLQDLEQNAPNIGTRELNSNAEAIVNQIRRILHTNWPRDDRKHLEALQKSGVAIMRSIEEKGDLPSAISDSGKELQKVLGDLGVKVNNLGSPEGLGDSPDEPSGTAKGQGKDDKSDQEPNVPPATQVGPGNAIGDPTQLPSPPTM